MASGYRIKHFVFKPKRECTLNSARVGRRKQGVRENVRNIARFARKEHRPLTPQVGSYILHLLSDRPSGAKLLQAAQGRLLDSARQSPSPTDPWRKPSRKQSQWRWFRSGGRRETRPSDAPNR